MASKKQQVADMLNAVKTGNARALTVLHPTIYKQHNPEIADGPTGIRAVLFAIKDTLQTNIVRIFQDGEYVFAHMDYFDAVTKGSGARVAFDIWRFEDGQVVEHWDNFQINHSDPNPFSGRTMTDGPTEVADLDRTETNKAVVRGLVEHRIAGRFDKLADYFVDGVYIQHNPTIDTSLAGLAALGENGPVYNRLHLVLGEGNFVLTTCEGSLKGQPTAFFDLFRLENGKIREHWDTIETIPPKTEHKNDNGKFEEMEKQQVVALLKGIETGDPAAFTVINPNKYIQHQFRAADGLHGLKEVAERAAGTAKVNTIRVYKDGDYVFTHTEYDIFGPKIGFDIFRFENGLIVEHWSNLQTTVPGPNPFSGRTMTDGPTRAVDLQQTEVNKAAVRGLLDDRIAGRFEKLAGYFVDGVYIQHNPTIDTSLKGLAVLGIDGPVYERIHLVLGEGNFVLSTTEGSLKGVPTAYFDLFRLENGKIREHWDVIETIPPREEHRNGNGKFWAAEKPMTNDFKNGNLVNGNGSPSTATTSNGTNKVTQEDLANGKPKASITNHNSTEKQEDLANGKPKASITNHNSTEKQEDLANGKPKASITNHNSTEKQQVVDLLKAIETGEQGPFEVIHPSRYIQHNLLAADGLEGVRGLMKLVSGSAKVNTVRVFQDGDYVFAHTDYDFFGPNIGFDIFRFDNGLIVEHWDNLQATPAGKNPSGHTMLDGPTDQTEKPKFVQTNANKALVRNFVNDMLINRRLEKLNDYYKGDEYVQHNPAFGDGVSALGPAFKAMAAASQNVKYTRIHLVLADGNFVLVVSEGAQGQNPTSFYDLFRVEKGKIVEHWDVVETIPPREQWQNDNGKF